MFTKHRKANQTALPLARSTLIKDCHKQSGIDRLTPQLQFINDLIESMNGLSRTFAMILLETGARPQEILNLVTGDSHTNGSILIRSAKKGQDRLAHSVTFRTMIPKENCDPTVQPFRNYSYRKFYRAVMKTGMIQTGNKLIHVPVGRLFRQAYASIVNDLSNGDIETVAHTLGHKQSKNSAYYLPKKG